jgi:putative PIN family toxin of toxin-antitoxin system
LRVVLDAVIFVRALINAASTSGQLLQRSDEFTILLSLDVTREILGVLLRTELQHRLYRLSGLPQLQLILGAISSAETVEPINRPAICRDPHDDKYFWCAADGRADYIVSEDQDILAIREYKGVRTVQAAEFLRLLDAANSER